MSSLEEQIKELEDELTKTPYNKATSKHIGRVKAKIARLKDEAVSRAMKAGGGGEGTRSRNPGMLLPSLSVSLPRVRARSQQLTGTESAVAAYAFTTLTVVPGALEHKGAKIQILDIPGLIAGAAMGKGRGKEVIAVVRNADIIIILVDVFNERHFDVLIKELYDAGIRINVRNPISPSRNHRMAVSGSMQSVPLILISRKCGRSLPRAR